MKPNIILMTSCEKILVLKNKTIPVTKVIKMGKRIQYQLVNDEVIHYGRIQQMQGDSLIINDNAVFLSKLKMIQGKPVRLDVVKGMGFILIVLGTIVLYLGIYALQSKHISGLFLPDALLSMAGIVIVYLGFAGDLLGLISFFIATKVYDIEKEWSAKIGVRQKNQFFFKKSRLDCCD